MARSINGWWFREEASEGEAGDTFAAPAFADDREGFASHQGERDSFDGFYGASFGSEINGEVTDFKDGSG